MLPCFLPVSRSSFFSSSSRSSPSSTGKEKRRRALCADFGLMIPVFCTVPMTGPRSLSLHPPDGGDHPRQGHTESRDPCGRNAPGFPAYIIPDDPPVHDTREIIHHIRNAGNWLLPEEGDAEIHYGGSHSGIGGEESFSGTSHLHFRRKNVRLSFI